MSGDLSLSASIPSVEETLAADDEHAQRSAQSPTTAAIPGERIGRYIILQRIGAGAMGEVFAAYDPELDRKVAIKLLHPERGDTTSTTGRSRFEREAQAMARLTHPNTITIHDVGEHRGRVFLAMEFVAGQTLGEWIEQPRGWQAVVGVFAAAGRGLAAAHLEGMVHRDFKPDNVMLTAGDGGRVLVMDFGLARAIDDPAESTSNSVTELVTDEALGHGSRLSSSLTRTGALTGTPAYMAPEQFLGRADARSDQFSFCVALYEALYGERPFAGENVAAIAFHVSRGEISPPPPGRKVPTWLRRVVVRGLANDPADRWPDLPALVEALEHDPRRARRGLVFGLVGLAIVVTPLALSARQSERREAERAAVCGGSEAELADLWSDERRTALRASMAATGLPYADRSASEVVELFDAWTARWVAGHRDACEASEVSRSQSVEVRDQRMRCLDRQRRYFASLVSELSAADSGALEAAVARSETLPVVERCSDLDYVAAAVPPPNDPAQAAAVAELRRELEPYRPAPGAHERERLAVQLGELEHLRERAEPLAYAPVLAEIDVQLGRRLQAAQRSAEAELVLRRAYFSARRHSDSATSIAAALELIDTIGDGLGRYRDGLDWGEHAEAEISLAGAPLDEAARLLAVNGVHQLLSEIVEGEAAVRAALAIYERELPDNALDLARAQADLAGALIRQERFDEAGPYLDRARAIYLERLGPDHPKLGEIDELRVLEALERDPGAALIRASALVEFYERVGVIEDPRRAAALQNLGKAQLMDQQPDAARASWETAMALRERLYGPEHPVIAGLLINLETLESGPLGPRIAALERAIGMYEAAGARQSHRAAAAHANLGIRLFDIGDLEQAASHFERASELFSRSQGEATEQATTLRFYHALALEKLGRPEQAAELLRRNIELLRTRESPSLALFDSYALLINIELGHENCQTARELVRDASNFSPPPLKIYTVFEYRFTLLRARHACGEAGVRDEVLSLQRELVDQPEAFPPKAPDELRAWLKKNR